MVGLRRIGLCWPLWFALAGPAAAQTTLNGFGLPQAPTPTKPVKKPTPNRAAAAQRAAQAAQLAADQAAAAQKQAADKAAADAALAKNESIFSSFIGEWSEGVTGGREYTADYFTCSASPKSICYKEVIKTSDIFTGPSYWTGDRQCATDLVIDPQSSSIHAGAAVVPLGVGAVHGSLFPGTFQVVQGSLQFKSDDGAWTMTLNHD
jgi:hypothetical protein